MPLLRYNLEPLLALLEQKATILVPNNRIRDALLEAHATRQSGSVWRTPDVQAIDIWLRKRWDFLARKGVEPCCNRQLIDSIDELPIWRRLIERDHGSFPLLDLDQLAAGARHAYQIMRLFQLPERVASGGQAGEHFLFQSWCRAYEEFCTRHQVLSLVDFTCRLARADHPALDGLPGTIALVDFHDPPPLYRALFEALRARTSTVEVATELGRQQPAVLRREYQTWQLELRDCVAWASKLLSEQRHLHIGIIHCAEKSQVRQLARSLNEALVEDYLVRPLDTWAIGGRPPQAGLLGQAMISDALQILELDGESQDSNDLCRLLQSRYLAGHLEEREARLRLELRLRDRLSARCTVTQLLQAASSAGKPYHCPVLAGALLKLRAIARGGSRANSMGAWIDMFTSQLDAAGWPGDITALTAAELRLLETWKGALFRSRRTSFLLGPLSRSAALAALRRTCGQIDPDPAVTPPAGLTLCTLEEAPGMLFDHLWFLGFNDQQQPGAPRPSPFISTRDQKDALVPGSHADVNLARARNLFGTVCRSVRFDIFASHSRTDGDQVYRPSGLISHIPLARGSAGPDNGTEAHAVPGTAANLLQWVEDVAAVPLAGGEAPRGGHRIISDQAACPFKAFALYRLKTRPLEEFPTGISYRDRGTAVHIALESLFGRIDSHAMLTTTPLADRMAAISGATQQALQFLDRQYPLLMTPRFRDIERQRIEHLLQSLLERESERQPFAVLATEASLEWVSGSLTIGLKIDRVDKLLDGGLALIDYKTGKNDRLSASDFIQERPLNMQLPVYYTATQSHFEQPVVALCITSVNVEKIAYSGLSETASMHPEVKALDKNPPGELDWSTLTASWRLKTTGLANEFLAGIASVAPTERAKVCRYCGLESLCRIRELDARLSHTTPEDDPAP